MWAKSLMGEPSTRDVEIHWKSEISFYRGVCVFSFVESHTCCIFAIFTTWDRTCRDLRTIFRTAPGKWEGNCKNKPDVPQVLYHQSIQMVVGRYIYNIYTQTLGFFQLRLEQGMHAKPQSSLLVQGWKGQNAAIYIYINTRTRICLTNVWPIVLPYRALTLRPLGHGQHAWKKKKNKTNPTDHTQHKFCDTL